VPCLARSSKPRAGNCTASGPHSGKPAGSCSLRHPTMSSPRACWSRWPRRGRLRVFRPPSCSRLTKPSMACAAVAVSSTAHQARPAADPRPPAGGELTQPGPPQPGPGTQEGKRITRVSAREPQAASFGVTPRDRHAAPVKHASPPIWAASPVAMAVLSGAQMRNSVRAQGSALFPELRFGLRAPSWAYPNGAGNGYLRPTTIESGPTSGST